MIGWLVAAGALLAGPLGAGWSPVSPTPRVPALPTADVAAAYTSAATASATVASRGDRWIAEDKVRHFALSFAATSMAYGGARLGLDPGPGRRAAAGLALLLGVGKELVDLRNGGRFSLKDLAWDAAGVALGSLLAQQIR
ncbi:MAG: hypothetical protein ACN0LA_15370 [Candidatus Longimicrobiales bacterium M2_2A_002]